METVALPTHATPVGAVDDAALIVALAERGVARVLELAREPVHRRVPVDLFPLGRARPAQQRLVPQPRADGELHLRRTLRAERPAVDGAVGVALDVDDGVLGVQAAAAVDVGDGPAADRAVRADRPVLGGVADLELADRGVRRPQIEAEGADREAAGDRGLQERAAGDVHGLSVL